MLRIVIIITALFFASCGNSPKTETVKPVEPPKSADTLKIPDNGEYIKRYKNGVIEIQGQMKSGKREGIWKSFYENGNPWSETTFENGIRNGLTISYYENGQKRYSGYFKNDMESGKWIFWDEQGNVAKEVDYAIK